jgi:WD40 repeat protein
MTASVADSSAVRMKLRAGAFADLKHGSADRTLELPLTPQRYVRLDLKRFEVTSGRTRFVVAGRGGEHPMPTPDVVLLRGHAAGHEHSTAFLMLTPRGAAVGFVQIPGEDRYVIQTARPASAHADPTISITHGPSGDLPPELDIFCGLRNESGITVQEPADVPEGGGAAVRGPRVAEVAIDADQNYVNLFANTDDAAAYVVQLIAAVSDIHLRDIDLKLHLAFVRLWPDGGEPFSAASISGFRNYWETNEDPEPYHMVHLLSGRRDLSYGGIAYVGGTCSSTAAFAISGFLLGNYPDPLAWASWGTWDVIVVAHEMGHNLGTYHTHDGYEPPIDSCGSGIPARGTIMSYCHTHPGGLTNIDLHMHRRVEDVIRAELAGGNCMAFDCNGNGIDDAADLAGGVSLDANANGIPDECEDCDGDGLRDDLEIVAGAPDVNANGIPDFCEPDCDGNAMPDALEIAAEMVADADGNNVPDGCDPDCNGNNVPDFDEIAADMALDIDRDRVPDVCQDCDANGLTDWVDLQRQHNVFVGSLDGFVREFHQRSGVPIGNLTASGGVTAYDVVFGPDRQLYAADYSRDRIIRFDVDTGAAVVFVSAGSGGLDGPAGLTFGPNGDLFVASRLNSRVIRYSGVNGAFIGTLVASGSGGLSQPYGLTFGPNGNLFLTSGNDRILEYSGADGSFVRVFVAAGSGGLDDPRGVVFKPDGNLLVTSFLSDQVIEYEGTMGTLVGAFNDDYPLTRPWGIRLGPNGNVYVTRTGSAIRVVEYGLLSGHYLRAYVRNDPGLTAPSAIDFRPASSTDCNQNAELDACDIAAGLSLDCNLNGHPDECDAIAGGDFDADGVVTLADASALSACLSGPTAAPAPPLAACVSACLAAFDLDVDADVDLRDGAQWVNALSGP